MYIYLATNQTDEMSAFTFLAYNKIEAACQKKEYCHYKTVQKFIHNKMQSQAARAHSTPKGITCDLVREEQSFWKQVDENFLISH